MFGTGQHADQDGLMFIRRKLASAASLERPMFVKTSDTMRRRRGGRSMQPNAMASGHTDVHEDTTPRRSAADIILDASFQAAAPPAIKRRLAENATEAVVVLVPSPAYVHPLESYFTRQFGARWYVITRDGMNRHEHKSSTGNSEVARALSEGRPVLGIAPSVEYLPSALVAAADFTVHTPTPNAEILRNALCAYFAKPAAVEVPLRVGAGLDFNDFVAAFRPRSRPQQIVDRLARATARQMGSDDEQSLPALETAIEYGAARKWALDLAQDISDLRKGLIGWSDISRGVVLYGEPGTGKTLFARMLAAHAGLPLIAFSIADLFAKNEGDLGAVINATNAIFARAAAAAPCITFCDELDALPNRATLSRRGRDWWLPVCENFLVKLDGVLAAQREGIIFVGATNYIDRIDSALLRPGRLELAIEIRRPDLAGTINILRHYVPALSPKDSLELGQLLEGATGAELMMVARDARRIARRNGRSLRAEDVRAAALPDEQIPPAHLRRVCIHEAAHAVGALVLSAGRLRGIVVSGKQGAAARTMFDREEPDLPTREIVEARVVVSLCGRAGEQLFLGEASVGSGGDEKSDLAMATHLIASLHASAGLGGTIAYTSDHDGALKAVRKDKRLRRRVERQLNALQKRARRIVVRYRDSISGIADALAATRYLSGDAVRGIFERRSQGGRRPSLSIRPSVPSICLGLTQRAAGPRACPRGRGRGRASRTRFLSGDRDPDDL
jgi:cell division protease FtsH